MVITISDSEEDEDECKQNERKRPSAEMEDLQDRVVKRFRAYPGHNVRVPVSFFLTESCFKLTNCVEALLL